MQTIIFITENTNKFKELDNYLKSTEFGKMVQLQMIKPNIELFEIQSLDRSLIIKHKLKDAFTYNNELFNCSQNYYITNSDTNGNEITSNNFDCNAPWIMVEDTSLCIDTMGGFPGPFIKYYLQSQSLQDISNDNWGSEAQSIVNLAIGRVIENNQIMMKDFEGVINGIIVSPMGTNGFGYDPIFRPRKSNITNAKMSMEEKAMFNPRTIAFQQVLEYITGYYTTK